VGENRPTEKPEIALWGAGEWAEKQVGGLETAADEFGIDYSLSSIQDIREEEDIEWLQDVKADYFRDGEVTNEPQDGFLEGADLVYIANRIDQHPEQIDNLIEEINQRELSTSIAVEKALSPAKERHYELQEKADKSGIEMSLVDHYEFKPQARGLEVSAHSKVQENGYITEAKFIAREQEDPKDENRRWVFEEDAGGIGLDWLPHLYSVMIGRLGARFDEESIQRLEAEPANYDTEFLGEDVPASVRVESPVYGKYFTDDAVVKGEVGKRYGESEKAIELTYENEETSYHRLGDVDGKISSNTYAALSLLDMAIDVPDDGRDHPHLDRMRPVYEALDQVYGEKSETEGAAVCD